MYDRETARWSMQLRKDGKWVDAYVVTAPLDGPSMEGLSLDEKSVVMSIRNEKAGGYELGPTSRSPTASWASSTARTAPSTPCWTTPTT